MTVPPGRDGASFRPRTLLFGNVTQPPFVNNLAGPVRAFGAACDLRVVEPRRIDGFVATGGAAPAPVPEAAVDLVADFEPELVVCLGGGLFVPDAVRRRLPGSATYVGIALSDPQGLPTCLSIAPGFDLFYSHDPSCFAAYEAAGIPVRECALAADAGLYFPSDEPPVNDVFFAGKWTPWRQAAVNALSREFRVRVHGYEGESRWETPAAAPLSTPEELRRGIASARLCLDFALLDDVAPPLRGAWRITNRPQIAAACGVPTLVETSPLLGRYFVPGEEIVPWSSVEDLVEQVRRLLAEPARCAGIGRRARERVLREHLWSHRVAAILADAREVRRAAGPRSPRLDSASGRG